MTTYSVARTNNYCSKVFIFASFFRSFGKECEAFESINSYFDNLLEWYGSVAKKTRTTRSRKYIHGKPPKLNELMFDKDISNNDDDVVCSN